MSLLPVEGYRSAPLIKTFTKRQIVSVTLFDDPWNPVKEPEVYFCPKCRMPVIEYQHQLMQEVPGGIPGTHPLRIRCKNKSCPREYHFHVITVGF